MEMDSSTSQKWSTHIVVRIPGYAFASVYHVKWFVNTVVEAAGKDVQEVVDMNVYHAPQHLRMLGSRKLNGSGVLVPTGRWFTALLKR